MPAQGGEPPDFRAGFVGLFGRPNVGKSTLLNVLIGQEIALATKFPQTTRERMLGVWTTPSFQAVLVDTPGMHRAKSALNRFMVHAAVQSAAGVDLLLFLAEMPGVVDAAGADKWRPGEGALAALDLLKSRGRPIVLVLTKCDVPSDRAFVLPVIDRWSEHHAFAAVVPTSARRKTGLDALRSEVASRLPVGPALYDPDHLSDRTMRWHAAEIIRGELFGALSDELPYSCAITVETFQEGPTACRVLATVHVERQSQKGIVIGAKGRQIRAISIGSRRRIAELAGQPCDLVLQVRVSDNWTKDPHKLAQFGYGPKGPGAGGKR